MGTDGTALAIGGSGAAVLTRPLVDLPPRERPRPRRLPRPRDVINAVSAFASLVSFSAVGKQHVGIYRRKVRVIDLFCGACAVKGNVQVAGHVKRVDHGDAFHT